MYSLLIFPKDKAPAAVLVSVDGLPPLFIKSVWNKITLIYICTPNISMAYKFNVYWSSKCWVSTVGALYFSIFQTGSIGWQCGKSEICTKHFIRTNEMKKMNTFKRCHKKECLLFIWISFSFTVFVAVVVHSEASVASHSVGLYAHTHTHTSTYLLGSSFNATQIPWIHTLFIPCTSRALFCCVVRSTPFGSLTKTKHYTH